MRKSNLWRQINFQGLCLERSLSDFVIQKPGFVQANLDVLALPGQPLIGRNRRRLARGHDAVGFATRDGEVDIVDRS